MHRTKWNSDSGQEERTLEVGVTVVTSQVKPKDWHAVIGDPTLADAILDRLELMGDSIWMEGGRGLDQGEQAGEVMNTHHR